MITIFTTPKPFINRNAIIQENAMHSWRALSPEVKIIIFGNSAGSGQAASSIGASHIPVVQSNHLGTPFINDMFAQAEKLSCTSLLCYINADIILPPTFIQTVKCAAQHFNRFLMVGIRSDLDWETKIDFASSESQRSFWQHASQNSRPHGVSGIDYFIYPRGIWKNPPELLAGRAGFDNWLIWRARRSLIPVIDASSMIFAVHQNHDYSHHPAGREGVFNGEEAAHNKKFLGEEYYQGLNILDAVYKFSGDQIVHKNSREEIRRYFNRLPRVFPELAVPLRLINRALSLFRV